MFSFGHCPNEGELKNTLYIFLYDGRKICTSCPKDNIFLKEVFPESKMDHIFAGISLLSFFILILSGGPSLSSLFIHPDQSDSAHRISPTPSHNNIQNPSSYRIGTSYNIKCIRKSWHGSDPPFWQCQDLSLP